MPVGELSVILPAVLFSEIVDTCERLTVAVAVFVEGDVAGDDVPVAMFVT